MRSSDTSRVMEAKTVIDQSCFLVEFQSITITFESAKQEKNAAILGVLMEKSGAILNSPIRLCVDELKVPDDSMIVGLNSCDGLIIDPHHKGC